MRSLTSLACPKSALSAAVVELSRLLLNLRDCIRPPSCTTGPLLAYVPSCALGRVSIVRRVKQCYSRLAGDLNREDRYVMDVAWEEST